MLTAVPFATYPLPGAPTALRIRSWPDPVDSFPAAVATALFDRFFLGIPPSAIYLRPLRGKSIDDLAAFIGAQIEVIAPLATTRTAPAARRLRLLYYDSSPPVYELVVPSLDVRWWPSGEGASPKESR